MDPTYGHDFAFDWSTMKEYMDRLDTQGIAVNVAPLVGHGTLRSHVIGYDDCTPTEDELKAMSILAGEAMNEGAWGLSSGLIYAPGCYAETEELIHLARIIAEWGGIYTSHIRGEGETLLPAVREAIAIGKAAGIPVEISHFKAAGKPYWGRVQHSLRLVAEARTRGVEVTVDQYPYTASSTGLSARLPSWVHDGGTERLLERLRDTSTRQRIREEMARTPRDWSTILIVSAPHHRDLQGKTVAEIAALQDKDPHDAVFDLLVAEQAVVQIVSFSMWEADVQQVMTSPYMMVGSDGSAVSPQGILGQGQVHPRYYGTFPRVLGHYVRDTHVLSLPDAVRRMTTMPAQKLGIHTRGLLREGMLADITVFDPLRVRDVATYLVPHQFPVGIECVVVNGRIVVERGEHRGTSPGKVLRKSMLLSP
jgi:N-acyl-D-amino-acid deacylase